MNQLDELLKLMPELEKRIEKLEGFGKEFHIKKEAITKEFREAFEKVGRII